MLKILRQNPSFIAYTIFSVLIIAAFVQADGARDQAKKDTCISALDTALAIRDIIDMSGGNSPNIPPDRQEQVRAIYARIELPPKICEGAGVDVEEYLTRPPTTTTIPGTPPTTGTSVGPQPEARSPPVSRTPDRIDPIPTTTTTTGTTAPPSTTTTTQPEEPPRDCTVVVADRCVVDLNPGTAGLTGIFPLKFWN